MFSLLNKVEVAALLNVSPRSVDRLRASGELRAVVIRGRIRFHPDDVHAFLDCKRQRGHS
jgi:excisionase family DNA binding protein